ncbi:hypothetical protein F4604DRAFT_1924208 [Suillus subluteus]|nr:hypothetical protein F4604DRAFT_1924208 [Suillus subluteus]
MEAQGHFDISADENSCVRTEEIANAGDCACMISESDVWLEDLWRSTYEERRDNFKKRAMPEENSDEQEYSDLPPPSIQTVDQSCLTIVDLGPMSTDAGTDSNRDVTDDGSRLIESVIIEYGLNDEQTHAFHIIVEHRCGKSEEPLRMFIGGAGGTGKSRVINALKEYFCRKGEQRRFRLVSFMGVAARNISGMTLHAVLGIGQQKK